MKEQMVSLMSQIENEIQAAQAKMIRIMEQDASRADKIQECLDAVKRKKSPWLLWREKGLPAMWRRNF